jgi:hypothetical protein
MLALLPPHKERARSAPTMAPEHFCNLLTLHELLALRPAEHRNDVAEATVSPMLELPAASAVQYGKRSAHVLSENQQHSHSWLCGFVGCTSRQAARVRKIRAPKCGSATKTQHMPLGFRAVPDSWDGMACVVGNEYGAVPPRLARHS